MSDPAAEFQWHVLKNSINNSQDIRVKNGVVRALEMLIDGGADLVIESPHRAIWLIVNELLNHDQQAVFRTAFDPEDPTAWDSLKD